MQTVAPCPEDSFMGAPMICCASAALKSEHGSIAVLCGCVGDGETEAVTPPLFDVFAGLLHPQNSTRQNIAVTMGG